MIRDNKRQLKILLLLISILAGLLPSAHLFAQGATSCQMNITDAGDSNPFTFFFEAINTQNIASYQWDFGDGQSDLNQSIGHTYTTTGTFNITLTCVPNSGPDMILNGSVSVSSTPVAGFFITPGTTGFSPFTISMVNTSTGGGLSYSWSVTGPETHSSTSFEPTFTFTAYGTYTITLTITDGAGQTAVISQSVQVVAPAPSASFSLSPASGTAPLNITVTSIDYATGPIDTWSWTFGDGIGTATGPGPHSYTYSNDGTYDVTLNYSGPGGSGTVTKQVGVYPPAQPVTASFTFNGSSNSSGSSVIACFTNTSTGPIATNTWDFGDGTGSIVDNGVVVCHTYAAEGTYTVYLTVADATNTATSNENRTISIWRAPLASFTTTVDGMANITWGTLVDFDSTGSTGTITAWEWDFDNDGVIDSTDQNPAGIAFNTLGNNTIKLTVTGPGGSSSVQKIIVVVVLSISCDFSGPLSVAPGSSANYAGTVGSLNGRTPTFSWSVTGSGLNISFNSQAITVNWPAVPGTYFVTFGAQTPDGANCSRSRTVQVEWPALSCTISGEAAPLPDSSAYTYTANVSNLAGRTLDSFRWYVDGVEQIGVTGNTFIRSWSNTASETISYTVSTSDGSGNCGKSIGVVVVWPSLVCDNISGSSPALPQLPNNPGRNYDYTANTTGTAGRPVIYNWSITAGTINSTNGATANLSWDISQAGINPPGAVSQTLNVTVQVTNPDGTTDDCSMSRTIAVEIPALVCNNATGDATPVVGETVNFGLNLGNGHGRTITAQSWIFEESDGAGGWINQQTGTGPTFGFTFGTPGQVYRIRYSASVTGPDESCQSGWKTITTTGTGFNFNCDAWRSGNTSPSSASTNYTYQVDIDNTNFINLQYRWVLIDSTNTERELLLTTSAADGTRSATFLGALLGPADNYTLRVYVQAVNPADSSHNCHLQTSLVVGTLNVDFTFTGNNNAVAVGQLICLTNISNTSHSDINALTYEWNFGTTDTSLGILTSALQQPGCLSFNSPGSYIITLRGTNASGLRTATKTVTFMVYGLQSISINRSNVTFAPANMSFSANGVNITGAYSWSFYDDATNTLLGTRTGANTTFFFSAAGRYRAVVTGSGPLGNTTATSTFELLAVNDIRAAFTASSYGGQAIFHVCFTDRSVGSTINSWEWDFGNGQTLSYTDTTIPSQICTDYVTPATVYSVRLTVRNSSNMSANATNAVRTYNLLESNASFTITPFANGQFCFNSVIPAGVSVVSWNFGDGTVITSGNMNTICHTYQGIGSYLVEMSITDGTNTGSIVRPLTVDLTGGGGAPNLAVSGNCSTNFTASFTVTNNGGAMTTPDQVTIRDNSGNIILSDASLVLAAGASKTYTVSYYGGAVTLTVSDAALAYSVNCNYPPDLSGSANCRADGTAVFSITNSSPDTGVNQAYTIVDNLGNIIKSGTLSLSTNATTEIEVTGSFAPLTFSTTGTQGPTSSLTLNQDCDEPPVLSGTAVCAMDGTAEFIIDNASANTAANQSYEIYDDNGLLVTRGVLTTAAGGSTRIRLTNVYGPLKFITSGGAQGSSTDLTLNTSCKRLPTLSGSSSCQIDGTAVFTVKNSSTAVPATQSYKVTTSGGQIVKAGSLNIPALGTDTISISGITSPLTLSTDGGGLSGLTVTTQCLPGAVVTALAQCLSSQQASFTLTNSSGSTQKRSYEVFNSAGSVIASGDLTLSAGQSSSFTVTDAAGSFTLITGGSSASTIMGSANCGSAQRSVTVEQTDSKARGGHTNYLPALDLTSGEIDEGLEKPEWDGLIFGGNICPDWILYHTNMTGDWEVFRLGDLHDGRIADPNLSQGRGEGVVDMAPTRSPDAEWVAFTSNRDGNWELYVARVDNSEIRRMTYNTIAKDIDPAWSPDGRFIAFETTRDGNWELYLYDMSTGEERRLTENEASDINAFWSHDSQKMVFQSDRSGKWQVYEIIIATGEEKLLSDGQGEDHDPAYAFDGSKVAFRSFREGHEDNSVLYVMNADGSDVHSISDKDGFASNHTWYLDDTIIAYQSDLDGDLDIYVYEFENDENRLVTDNDIEDFAPTWHCNAPIVVFTSDVLGDPNIFNTPALPIEKEPILVDEEANQMTFDEADDVYPESSPTEENASREGDVPPRLKN